MCVHASDEFNTDEHRDTIGCSLYVQSISIRNNETKNKSYTYKVQINILNYQIIIEEIYRKIIKRNIFLPE